MKFCFWNVHVTLTLLTILCLISFNFNFSLILSKVSLICLNSKFWFCSYGFEIYTYSLVLTFYSCFCLKLAIVSSWHFWFEAKIWNLSRLGFFIFNKTRLECSSFYIFCKYAYSETIILQKDFTNKSINQKINK